MKKILIIAAIAGIAGAVGCSQNKDCPCGDTAATKTTAVTTTVAKPGATQPVAIPFTQARPIGVEYSKAYTGNYPKKVDRLKIDRPVVTTPPIDHDDAATEAYYHYTPSTNDRPMPCYQYVQNNIIVRECPDRFYDNRKEPLTAAPIIEYSNDNSYTGYYPDDTKSKDPKAMENRVIENTNFPGDNLSYWDSY